MWIRGVTWLWHQNHSDYKYGKQNSRSYTEIVPGMKNHDFIFIFIKEALVIFRDFLYAKYII